MQIINFVAVATAAFSASVSAQISGSPCLINGLAACNNFADGKNSSVVMCQQGLWQTLAVCGSGMYCEDTFGNAGCTPASR